MTRRHAEAVTGAWTPIATRPAPGSCGENHPCAGSWTGTVALFPASGLAYDPAADRWAAMPPYPSADSTLAIIKVDGRTLTLLATVPIGKGSREEVCVSPDGKRAYVSNDKDNSSTAVDLETREVIATIPLPGVKHAEGCAESPDGKKLYVAGMQSDNVAVQRLIGSISEHLTYVPQGGGARQVIVDLAA